MYTCLAACTFDSMSGRWELGLPHVNDSTTNSILQPVSAHGSVCSSRACIFVLHVKAILQSLARAEARCAVSTCSNNIVFKQFNY